MVQSHSTRPKTSQAAAPGVKLLVTAASFTAMLGGWVAFTLQQNPQAAAAGPVGDDIQAASSMEVLIDLPPLPTLVPQPSLQGFPTAPQPAAQPASALSLRSVQAPQVIQVQSKPRQRPRPVTVTRSSR